MAKRTNINWPAVIMTVYYVAFWAIIGITLASVLTSCRTVTTTEQTHTTHTFEADTLSKEAKHDTHVSQQTVNLDSIVTLIWQRTMEEFARQEQEHEITTETLTETIDSLGNVIRQTQKTTDRTTTKQEQQRIDRMEQTVRQEIHEAMARQDSVWQARFSEYQASVRDSIEAVRDYQKTASPAQPLSWWAKAWTWLKGILVGIVLGVIIVLWRNIYADFKRIAKKGIDKFY